MKKIDLSEVSIKNAVRIMMEETEYEQFKQVAEALDIKKTTFQSMLDRETFRVEDLQSIANLLGYSLELHRKE